MLFSKCTPQAVLEDWVMDRLCASRKRAAICWAVVVSSVLPLRPCKLTRKITPKMATRPMTKTNSMMVVPFFIKTG